MELKKQGYFKEMPHGEETDPSIMQALEYPYAPKDIEKICAYLDAGVPLVICCGTSQDVVQPENGVAGNPSMLTDGVWVWPGDLSYYVRRYKIRLGKDFLLYMQNNEWQIKVNVQQLEQEQIVVDGQLLW